MSAERKISTRVYDALKWAVLLAWGYHFGRVSPSPRSAATRDSWGMLALLITINILIETIDYTVRRLHVRRQQRKALLSLIER